MEIDNIYNMDCLEGMKQIPDGTIDAVICDLPYGMLDKDNEHTKWDCAIPFDLLWAEYRRITKPNAAVVLFGSGMFTADLMHSNPKMWRYNLIWKKGNRVSGFMQAKKAPLRNHEDIVVFYRQQPTYNPIMTKGERNHETAKELQYSSRLYANTDIVRIQNTSDMKYPKSVIDIDKEFDLSEIFHPTQKPVDLLRYLVLTYTNEGDTVLDNCMGSGTTAIACIKERRHFIGFELNKEYFNKACKRIDLEQRQLTLF